MFMMGDTERDHEFAAQVAAKLPPDRFEWRIRTVSHEQSFYRGIAELIQRGLIAESDITGKYFTNPAIYWNGDRARFITEMKQAPQILGPDDPDPTPGSGPFHEVPFSDDDELGH